LKISEICNTLLLELLFVEPWAIFFQQMTYFRHPNGSAKFGVRQCELLHMSRG